MQAIFLHYYGEAPEKAGSALNKLLLRANILAADFVSARRRIAALPEEEAHIGAAWEASIAFLTGDNDTALAGFRDALKRLRKAAGKRKVALEAEAGLFHMLALLRAGDSALHSELRGLIDAATQEVTLFHHAHRAIEALLDLSEGRHEKARETVKRLLEQSQGASLGAAIVALASMFADTALAREFVRQHESRYNRLVQSMPILARIYAEILVKTARDAESWRERAAAAGGKDLIAFGEIIAFKQPWERAFETLTAFLAPAQAKRPVEKAPAKAKRLAWFVDLTNGEVTVVEQSPKGAGWTSGRPIALKRLHQRDAKLDYLTERDQRMCRCVRKEQGWYGEGNFYFDEYATLPALAGHPNVYNCAKPSERIELIAYPVELVVKETAKGYNFNLSHRAVEPKVFLEAETPTRWRVVELSKKLLELQATLSEQGLTVPHDMRDRVAGLLSEANPTVPIRSELADIDVPAVPGDATPVMQLQRHGDGLKVRLGMRPFGADGPFYLAGQGGSSVLVTANGQRQRVNRDLDAETAALQALLKACPALLSWGLNGNECGIEALEDVLEFLEQAQSYKGPVNFEWPEGEALKVNRTVGAQGLSIKLKQQRDWFEVSGKIEVDEDLVIDMKEVLSRLDKAHGRFVPLDGGRFVALTTDLLKQLRRWRACRRKPPGGASFMAWPPLRLTISWRARARCRPISTGASCRRASARRARTRRKCPPRYRPSCATIRPRASHGCRGSPICKWEPALPTTWVSARRCKPSR